MTALPGEKKGKIAHCSRIWENQAIQVHIESPGLATSATGIEHEPPATIASVLTAQTIKSSAAILACLPRITRANRPDRRYAKL
jgi:hypothetical protein